VTPFVQTVAPQVRAGRALLLALALWCGCSYSQREHPQACQRDADCREGQYCYEAYCVPRNGSIPDSGAGAPDAGELCVSGQPPEDCYDGPEGTSNTGVCKSGQRACVGGVYTQCLGQVLPSDETCNGKDDNCDGTIDEIVVGDCDTSMPGACSAGHLICRGAYAVCEVSNPAIDETCNGVDDDCDGKVDEVANTGCYPKDTDGCTIASDGTATCEGLCHAGVSACTDGASVCNDAITPAPEVCTANKGVGADEDCDGLIDEGCACSSGASRSCYSGQAGTQNNAPCHAGTQACSNGAWGDCVGQVLPNPPETCANMGVDDDCNGMVDDVTTLGTACIDDSKMGVCRIGTYQCGDSSSLAPACVTVEPTPEKCDAIDQDCDGDPYNGFDLTSDPKNCGKCGHACSIGDVCCQGNCVSSISFQTDAQNCGGCGNLCGRGQYCCQGDCLANAVKGGNTCACVTDCGAQSCCGTSCVDLDTDTKNCGSCGHACASGEVCCGTRGCTSANACLIKIL
jgi:hypothetical protein